MTGEIGQETSAWVECTFDDLLAYIQPTNFIVDSTDYDDSYETPVLTAGKSFIKGYTNEEHGVFENLPVIIFDDFTTASRYVNFPFKVKSSAMKILAPGCKLVNLKMVYYLMRANPIRSDTHKRYWISVYAKKRLLLPPLNEQDRIVAKIEELFSELDRGIESLNTAREQLKVYRQSVLKHAFEGKLTEGWREDNKDKLETADELLDRIKQEREANYQQQLEVWKSAVKTWEQIGRDGKKPVKTQTLVVTGHPEIPEDLAEHCTDQWTWLKLCDISEVSGGLTKNQKRNALIKKMKYLRVANIYADKLLLDEVTEIGVTEYEFSKLELAAGDLLVVEGNGSIDQIGRLAEWTGEIDQIGHQNHLIRVRMISGMRPRFFLLFLLSPLGRKFIIKQASSTTGLHTLSISKVSGLPVPVPNLDEQEAILTEVDDILSQINKMESEISDETKRSEGLRQSILKRAFSGKLVAQDANDEPASALLERIKAKNLVTRGKKRNAA